MGDRNGQGEVGALIGAAAIQGAVLAIGITLILPSELLALEGGGSETRPALAAALSGAGVGWASNANRAPVSL